MLRYCGNGDVFLWTSSPTKIEGVLTLGIEMLMAVDQPPAVLLTRLFASVAALPRYEITRV